MIDTLLKALILGAGAVADGASAIANIAQNKANERAKKLDAPIGTLLLERAKADMERRRKERRGK
jgi:hypothetical protein